MKNMNTTKFISLYPWYGGKARLVKEIIEKMPKKFEVYVEPFMGAASVFLAQPKDNYKKAVLNDYDEDVVHLFRILADKEKSSSLIQRVSELSVDYLDFLIAKVNESYGFDSVDDIERAVMVYRIVSQSFNGIRKHFRAGMDDEKYKKSVRKRVRYAIEKLQGNVTIENKDALEIIQAYKDEEKAFLFVDSPYLPSLRAERALKVYSNEPDIIYHVDMLRLLKKSKAKIMICGYYEWWETLYDDELEVGSESSPWRRIKLADVPKSCQRGNKKDMVEEYIWVNYDTGRCEEEV